MIKLYDEQKLELIKELKEYYNKSTKYIEELKEKSKTEEWISYINLDMYENENKKLVELVAYLEKDLNKVDDEKWNSLLVFLNMSTPPTPYELDNTLIKEGKENNNEFSGIAGIIGLMAVAAIFGGNSNNWGLKNTLKDIITDTDKKDLN